MNAIRFNSETNVNRFPQKRSESSCRSSRISLLTSPLKSLSLPKLKERVTTPYAKKCLQKQVWPLWKKVAIGAAAVLATAALVHVISSCFFSNEISALGQSSKRAVSEGTSLLQKVETILGTEGKIEWDGRASMNGVYLIKNKMGETIATFKPEDERVYGPNNRNILLRQNDLPPDQLINQSVWEQGFSSERQFLTKQFDLGNIARAPQGFIATLESDLFFDKNSKADEPLRKLRKLGYLQAWIPNVEPLWKADSKQGQEFDFIDYSILNKVPLNEFQKIGILDFITFNSDRHSANVLMRTDSEGIPHMIPIDHDHTFPCNLRYFYGGVFTHPVAEKPFTKESRDLIDQFDPRNVEELIIKSGLPEQVVRNTKALIITLKKFAKDSRLTLSDIYRFARSLTHATGHSAMGLILDEINKKAILKFDEKEIESIKLRSWTSPETLTQKDHRKLGEYDKVFWAEFQTRIDAEVQKISSEKQK